MITNTPIIPVSSTSSRSKKTLSKLASLGLLGVLALFPAQDAQATMVITYAEAVGVVNSSLSNTFVFDFDKLPSDNSNIGLGLSENVAWQGVGQFDKIYTKIADVYGGAAGSHYSVQGTGTVVEETTLTLLKPSSYFGLWWSAGDAANLLEFYLDDVLVGKFTTANLLKQLPEEYYGNPTDEFKGLGSNEPYAFINFFGDDMAWDKIVLKNSSGSGFEADNYTSREAPWTIAEGPRPGVVVEYIDIIDGETVVTPVPEPGSIMLLAVAAWTFIGASRRRRISAK